MLVALLSCTKEKLNKRSSVIDMFSACREFKAAYSYASLVADRVFVLSSKYGLMECDDEIDPITENMALKPPYEKRLWAVNVIDKLSRSCSPEEDEFLIFAGKEYFEYLTGELRKVRFPLENVPDDEKCQRLKRLEEEELEIISPGNVHRLFDAAPEYTWDHIGDIPFSNGVYVMFEKGEQFRGYKRIIRVGTHRGDGNLKSRLETHFIREDKNWSIFRKNIGRAILNKENDPYLKIWDMDTGTPEARQRYADLIDEVKENGIEKRISLFLRHHVTFSCVEVDSWFDRLRIEEGLIATLNQDPEFRPSKEWFGKYSPEYEIRNSGLWLKRGLDKVPLKRRDIELMEASIQKQIERGQKTDGECLEERVRELVMQKKQAASALNLRYIDIYSEDIKNEIDSGCTDEEVICALKKNMDNDTKIMMSTSNADGSMELIRYYL
ncbi:MAG TPA: hypothetical protein PLP30_08535 [Clostridia bacterium]|nr:hypothetical protein [Clostridia bacterium]HRX42622.1 hypothetical protein [Clostridia bacterium]